MEGFFGTLEALPLLLRDFTPLKKLDEAQKRLRHWYSDHWLPERLRYLSRWQTRREAACPRGCCMSTIQ